MWQSTRRCPPPTATWRAASSRTTPRPRPSSAACGRRSPPRRTSPPRRPGWAPLSSSPTSPCPRLLWTRCSNTSTRRMTPWRARWGADDRPRRGRTRREETPLRAGSSYRRRSSATTPWQRAPRPRTRQTRPGTVSTRRQRSTIKCRLACNCCSLKGVQSPKGNANEAQGCMSSRLTKR